MKIMCLIKITCPLNDGIAPNPFAPTIRKDRFIHTSDDWYRNFLKLSDPYLYQKFDVEEFLHEHTPNTPYQRRTDHSSILLFDSEEELNAWANNCQLTDHPLLIADQETWKTAHGITWIYEYYSLSLTTGPDPII